MTWLCFMMPQALGGKTQTAEGDSAPRKWNYLEVLGWWNVGLSWSCQCTYMWPPHVAWYLHNMAGSLRSWDFADGDARVQKWASQWTRQKLHCPYDLVREVTEHHFCRILSEEAVASLFRFKERKDRSICQWEKSLNRLAFFFFNTAGYKGPRKVQESVLEQFLGIINDIFVFSQALCLAKHRTFMSKQCRTWTGFGCEQACLAFSWR